MPTSALLPLVITAALISLILLRPRVRSGPSVARLAAEVGIATLALVAFLYGLLAADSVCRGDARVEPERGIV
jgi:hypothetical protein